jgi:hypothetical protein
MLPTRNLVALLTTLATAGAVAAAVAPGAAGAVTTTTVTVAQNVCKAPSPGHKSCDAMRLVTERVPSAVAGRLQAAGLVRTGLPSDLQAGPAGGYTPAELAAAYGLSPGAATTQTVAIVDAFNDPTVKADLNHFDTQYGLPAETSTSFRVVNQSGNATPLPSDDAGWAGEITLDVQAVRGLCHQCKILLVEAQDSSNANLATAVNRAVAMGAKIVSNSYGGPENDPANTATIQQAYNHPRVAILASTGDHGWYDWDFWNEGCPNGCDTGTDKPANVPATPASYNTVIGVGGTSLYLNPNGSRASETVWNDDGPGDIWGFNLGAPMGAAGSGCSTLFAPRLWQQKVAGYGSLGCGNGKRDDVDIAAVADPFTGFDIYQGFGNGCQPAVAACWETIGGTSLASPAVAAMWALAGGPGGVAYPALSLYGHFKSVSRPMYDVTVGGTGLCDTSSPTACFGSSNPNTALGAEVDCAWGASGSAVLANRGQCYARPGYDGVSGVGTPKGVAVFKPMSPTAHIASPGTVTHNVTKTFSAFGSSDPFPGGVIKTYTWNWGDGHTTSATNVSTTHKYTSKGIRTIVLTVTDNYGRSGSTKRTITVG